MLMHPDNTEKPLITNVSRFVTFMWNETASKPSIDSFDTRDGLIFAMNCYDFFSIPKMYSLTFPPLKVLIQMFSSTIMGGLNNPEITVNIAHRFGS